MDLYKTFVILKCDGVELLSTEYKHKMLSVLASSIICLYLKCEKKGSLPVVMGETHLRYYCSPRD